MLVKVEFRKIVVWGFIIRLELDRLAKFLGGFLNLLFLQIQEPEIISYLSGGSIFQARLISGNRQFRVGRIIVVKTSQNKIDLIHLIKGLQHLIS